MSLFKLPLKDCGNSYNNKLISLLCSSCKMDNTTSVLHEVKEFCNETSIHGLGQIANDRAWVIKRLLWFGVVVACFTYAGYQLSFKIEADSGFFLDS